MTDKAIILDTPDQIAMFHLLQIKYALRIEVQTGMTNSRGSILRLANRVLTDNGMKRRGTKAAALKDIEKVIEAKAAKMRGEA